MMAGVAEQVGDDFAWLYMNKPLLNFYRLSGPEAYYGKLGIAGLVGNPVFGFPFSGSAAAS